MQCKRYATVQRVLTKETTLFACDDIAKQQIFGLLSTDLAQIKPNYEAMVKGGTLRISDDGYTQGKSITIFISFKVSIVRVSFFYVNRLLFSIFQILFLHCVRYLMIP